MRKIDQELRYDIHYNLEIVCGKNILLVVESVANHNIPDEVIDMDNSCRVLRKIIEDGKIKYWRNQI